MKRPLDELAALKEELGVNVFYTGDIFDTWNQPPELINFAIKSLPGGYSIPGQHDLPYHRYEDMNKSAYGVLANSGVLIDVGIGKRFDVGNPNGTRLNLYGLPWGHINDDPQAKEVPKDRLLNVLIGHVYAWDNGHLYPGAEGWGRVDVLSKWFAKHWPFVSTLAFGDNHSGFDYFSDVVTEPRVFVNGKFMVRKSDEEGEYKLPRVGILYADGFVKPHNLSVVNDVYLTDGKGRDGFTKEKKEELESFAEILKYTSGSRADFRMAVQNYCVNNRLHAKATQLVMKLVDGDDYVR